MFLTSTFREVLCALRALSVRFEDKMADALNALEKQFLTYCGKRGEMVAPEELAAVLSGWAEGRRALWFDPRTLKPEERKRYKSFRGRVSRCIRTLFEKGYADIGNEDTYGEGIKRHYARIWEAQQKKSYWLGEGSPEFVERTIAFSKELMETTDFEFAKQELGGKIEWVGLTGEGMKKAKEW